MIRAFLNAFSSVYSEAWRLFPFAVPVRPGLFVSLNDENHASYPID
jgi:hypothetical protein